jgi:hypothetical protein
MNTPGTTIPFAGTERFEVISVIDKGGMGVVYEVFDWERQVKVALKTFLTGSRGEAGRPRSR